MTSNKAIDVQAFFQTVGRGSITAMIELLTGSEIEEITRTANTFNSEVETPLIVAIKGEHYTMVRYLVEVLKANICQLGCFIWKEFDYTQVPPLFAAICCDTSLHRLC